MNRFVQWLVLALALIGGVVVAQRAESPNAGPFRTISDGADDKLMLYGYDAVGYFKQGEALKGDPAIKAEHLSVTWRFASEANRVEFLKSPEKYMPQFGGYCSNGINYAIPGGGGGMPNSWRIYRGKLYVFGGQASRDHFEMDTELNLKRAHHYWNDEIAGSNPRWTRFKRMIFRVPHYQSDRGLQQEWEAKLAARTLPVMPGTQQVVPR